VTLSHSDDVGDELASTARQTITMDSEFDEGQLIDAVRAGEPSAGPVLVSTIAPGLLAYARSHAPDLSTTDLELLCETTVERAIAKIDAFDPTHGTFKAWARGILRLEIRALRRRQGSQALPLNEDLTADSEPSAVITQITEEVAAAVLRGVRALGHGDQLILQMRNAEVMSYQSIAFLLGIDEATCRQRHSRATRRLARRLENDPTIHEFLQRRRPNGR
jgi:RNA polymerase sigma factor (sigma-70 family)